MSYGVLWYVAMEVVRARGGMIWCLDTKIARSLMLRDMRDISNVSEWEYQHWLAARTKTKAKKASLT
jgi:hypothetical protein